MQVTVADRRVSYEFTLNRKYTILRGESASGKTALYSLICRYERGDRSVSLTAPMPCISASSLGWQWGRQLEESPPSIVFIDEDSTWVRTKEFASVAQGCKHYFVIISRHPLEHIPYSVREIYSIASSGRQHTFKLEVNLCTLKP